MPFTVANYVSACSQGQRTHSAWTNIAIILLHCDLDEATLNIASMVAILDEATFDAVTLDAGIGCYRFEAS